MVNEDSASRGAVLFDVDGTLVDSNYLNVTAWAWALRDVGHPVAASRIHRCLGLDGSFLLAELLGDELAEQVGDRANEAHQEHYQAAFDQLRAFDGARDLVRAVAGRARAVLVTSASTPELEALRATLDIEDDLAVVTSAADVDTAKPEPDIVQVALDRAGVRASDAVFVGDTVWDVEAAGRAGLSCIGVLTGGIGEAELREAGAVAVYDDVAALLAGLDTSPLAPVLRLNEGGQ